MVILLGIAAYLGIALFVGRFLSISSRGDVLYPSAGASVPPLYSPEVTVNLSVHEPRAERTGPRKREERKEKIRV